MLVKEKFPDALINEFFGIDLLKSFLMSFLMIYFKIEDEYFPNNVIPPTKSACNDSSIGGLRLKINNLRVIYLLNIFDTHTLTIIN